MADLSYPYAYAWDAVKKGIDNQGPYYTLSYWFDDYSVSDDVCNQLMGYNRRTGSSTVRQTPHQFPLSPNLFCTDVSVRPCGKPILNAKGQIQVNGGFFADVTYRSRTMMLQQEQD